MERHGNVTDRRKSQCPRLWKGSGQHSPGQPAAGVGLCSGMHPPITFHLFVVLPKIQIPGTQNTIAHLLVREEQGTKPNSLASLSPLGERSFLKKNWGADTSGGGNKCQETKYSLCYPAFLSRWPLYEPKCHYADP